MFFFFKQKTAYEMRISDWSSDVCSSDLAKIIGEQVGTRYRGFEYARAFEAAEGEIMPPLPLALFAGGGEANGGIVEQALRGGVGRRQRAVADIGGDRRFEIGDRRAERGLKFGEDVVDERGGDRKSTRLNSSH